MNAVANVTATTEPPAEATPDAGLPAGALEAAGNVSETGAAPSEGEAAAAETTEAAPDKVAVAAETARQRLTDIMRRERRREQARDHPQVHLRLIAGAGARRW